MSAIVWLLIRLGYLFGGVAALWIAGGLFNRWVQHSIRRHVRRALDEPITYLPFERALRQHPSNVRKIDAPRRLG